MLWCSGWSPLVLAAGLGEPNLVAIGNSITMHGPSAAIAWSGNWGMAAASENADYVGRLQVLLAARNSAHSEPKPPAVRIGFTDLERTPNSAQLHATALAAARASRWLVLQLGDNVPAGPATEFGRAYARLALQARPENGSLFCLSTWWARSDIDTVIEAACQAARGRFVFIGDLLSARKGAAPTRPGISDPGVLAHPGDAEMAQIAQRIFLALLKTAN